MIVNGHSLIQLSPIEDMYGTKLVHEDSNTSYGLTEAGYDIRIAQDVQFYSGMFKKVRIENQVNKGNFVLASSVERFAMPDSLVGVVHDKSSWARRGLSVFNTVIENGFEGYLTLELMFHGSKGLYIPKGAGIAQVLFHRTTNPSKYEGKYNHQPNYPVEAK